MNTLIASKSNDNKRRSKKAIQERKLNELNKEIKAPKPSDLFKEPTSHESLLKDAPSLYSYFQKFNAIKRKAVKAIREGRVFIIIGHFPVIRRELQKRGWIEKIVGQAPESIPNHQTLLTYAEDGNEFERLILSNLVSEYPADFVFSPGTEACLRYVHDFALWNRIRVGRNKNFTRKDGLCDCLQEAHFHTIENKAEVNTPRSFVIHFGDVDEFQYEYQLTTFRCLLYFLNENAEKMSLFITEKSETDSNIVESNLIHQICDKLLQIIQSETQHIDIEIDFDQIEINSDRWSEILKAYKNITENNFKVWVSKTCLDELILKIKEITVQSLLHWPHTRHDGYRNLWLVKPHNLCGGNGVLLIDNYEDIVTNAKLKSVTNRCVIQKYVEAPLLIYDTKFDIRYFFMITVDMNFVKIWEYTTCYLRFSSHNYDLHDLREQIHLTNHTIQQRYQNGPRNEKLPPHNMWHLYEFQEYLEWIGHGDVWKKKLHPDIRKNLIGVVLASMEDLEMKPNRFQIYGADFLITNDFDIYLLEVNYSPALATNTTVVTEVVFRKVLEDAMKVVLDYSPEYSCPTGDFELIHKIEIPRCKNSVYGMTIDGTKIFPTSFNKTRPFSKIERPVTAFTSTRNALNPTGIPDFVWQTNQSKRYFKDSLPYRDVKDMKQTTTRALPNRRPMTVNQVLGIQLSTIKNTPGDSSSKVKRKKNKFDSILNINTIGKI